MVDGVGQNPLMLPTNCKVARPRKNQWRLEEMIRFFKQKYWLEGIQVLNCERLHKLPMKVVVTSYFASVYLCKRSKLAILVQHIERAGKRIYGIPEWS